MKRLSIDDVFKPGGKIRTERIDFSLPENAELKRLFDETNKRQKEIQRQSEWTQADYDSMRNVITI